MNLRKKVKVLMILIAISVFSALPLRSSNAALIVTRGEIVRGATQPWFAIGCLLLLPVCAFDEESDAAVGVSREMLSESGYSEMEVESIMNDQDRAFSYLFANNIQLKLEQGDSVNTVVGLFKEGGIDVSQKYAEFLLDYNGL